jgi:transcriptional regulator with XRE-family HTH domain
MSLGHLLKLVRTHRQLNQKEMAGLLGISQNYLSLIESDKKQPSSELISRIARSLNVSNDALGFVASDVPDELTKDDKITYRKLQSNILTILLFQMTGELKSLA